MATISKAVGKAAEFEIISVKRPFSSSLLLGEIRRAQIGLGLPRGQEHADPNPDEIRRIAIR